MWVIINEEEVTDLNVILQVFDMIGIDLMSKSLIPFNGMNWLLFIVIKCFNSIIINTPFIYTLNNYNSIFIKLVIIIKILFHSFNTLI